MASQLWDRTPASVAVFRALCLGDLLCAMPALRALRLALPKARITLIGLESARPVVKRFSHYLDELVVFPGHPKFPEQPARESELSDFYDAMRLRRFDLALQMHGNGLLSNSIVSALGARQWAGFVPLIEQEEPRRLMAWPDNQPEVVRYISLLSHLGLQDQGVALEFPIDEVDRKEADDVAEKANLELARTIFIHPGAKLESRRWPAERFAEVGRQLALQGWQLAITGTTEEHSLASGLATSIGKAAVDISGQTTLGALASLLQRGRLLICNDTGVSHIAAAIGLRSVVIACGSDVARWAPLDSALHTVLHADMSCRPCSYPVCPLGHPCALRVTCNDVLEPIRAYLAQGAACEQNC
ncbi:glycosyltransferase family 9 protein [Candidimonas sp. SYP-B2681]|uniref:glycosyltransferase family 9 protein n=1 Tax=Candidimonas sp. SYP-B2681 TaxID=2497686 RepID=UPI000F85C95F|nr:glycosyltransferase family 9 protein [Candidimonas sp. SYP-B2681]RTZ48140.1 glycosyltransferase family 9 protein [Candidimonas sp. SYP-B2681]